MELRYWKASVLAALLFGLTLGHIGGYHDCSSNKGRTTLGPISELQSESKFNTDEAHSGRRI